MLTAVLQRCLPYWLSTHWFSLLPQIDAWQALTAATVQDASVSCPAPSQGPAAAGPASAGGQVQMVCSVPSGARTKNRNVQPLGKRTLALSPDF